METDHGIHTLPFCMELYRQPSPRYAEHASLHARRAGPMKRTFSRSALLSAWATSSTPREVVDTPCDFTRFQPPLAVVISSGVRVLNSERFLLISISANAVA